jgi:hypothetical protein
MFLMMCGALYSVGLGESMQEPEPGVGRGLARFRAAHYSDVRYELNLQVEPKAPMLRGRELIRVTLDGEVGQLVIDWRVATAKEGQPQARVWNIRSNNRSVDDARMANDHIMIPGAYLHRGENILDLEFESPIAASGSALTRYMDREDGAEYIYALFVPSDASTAFPCIATTGEARNDLKKILRGELKIPGMTLRTRDRFDIITFLLARGDADDARRYAYAAGAARAAELTKKKYFEAYLNDKQLAESWIEASLGPFNSLRQTALTLPYLEPALEELPTLKRTRKMFFVNGWLAAFVGGQCSADAFNVVQNFLAREGALDRDLRLKVLEVTDGLERCVRIRTKYAGEAGPD